MKIFIVIGASAIPFVISAVFFGIGQTTLGILFFFVAIGLAVFALTRS